MGCGCSKNSTRLTAIKADKPVGSVTTTDLECIRERQSICNSCINKVTVKSDFTVVKCKINGRLVDNFVLGDEPCPDNKW